MRRIKIAVDVTRIDSGPKVVGVISVLPREGKSTVSANLARLIASQGARTLLIDADLRGLGLTRVMASGQLVDTPRKTLPVDPGEMVPVGSAFVVATDVLGKATLTKVAPDTGAVLARTETKFPGR